MLEAAIREAGAKAEQTILIGDTSYDMLMAKNAGAIGLGVSWGYHAPEDLEAAGAHVIADEPGNCRLLSRAFMPAFPPLSRNGQCHEP
ncbi:hypothetical protein JCM17845_25960 [Iodidimonas gelatinilytica]|nr:HAD hydrolase-like protein [Iodidimonas gelatinilytica]GER01973.1 hypothetical protein JCM17845_25960 [Iodidimonas gelatinilytica]